MKKTVPSVSDLRSIFEPWEIAVATNVVDGFRRTCQRLEHEDFDELMQIALLEWLEKRPAYNPAKNCKPQTFMAQVVRNRLLDMAKQALAQKRNPEVEREYSLDAHIKEEDGDYITLEDVVADHRDARSRGAWELGVDISPTLAFLTRRQREICAALYASPHIGEASRALGLPRTTVHSEILRIRKIFAMHGVDGDFK